jgi:hypothetical protein
METAIRRESTSARLHIDVNTATSADPSQGRSRVEASIEKYVSKSADKSVPFYDGLVAFCPSHKCTIAEGSSVTCGSYFRRPEKRRHFPPLLSILTIVKNFSGFNIPAGWARRSFKRRVVNRLEPLEAFNIPVPEQAFAIAGIAAIAFASGAEGET